jgi:hypothetical protein
MTKLQLNKKPKTTKKQPLAVKPLLPLQPSKNKNK